MSEYHNSPDFWDYGEGKEDLMHRIHSYPGEISCFYNDQGFAIWLKKKGWKSKL